MSHYRKIDTRIWTDEKFRTLSNDARYFFIYLLTSPHSTAWGAYVLDDLYIQADLGFSPTKIKQLWLELANSRLTLRDEKTRLVCFVNWFKYNPPANEKTAIACIKGIMSLPKSLTLSMYCEKSEWVRTKLANLNLTVSEQLDDEHSALSTEQEHSALSTEQEGSSLPLPDDISPESWNAFVEMRKGMKKIPFTDYAARLILAELEKIHSETGQSKNAILDASTKNGWRDVYPLKTGTNGTGPPRTGTSKTAGNWAIVERMAREAQEKGAQDDGQ